ncbi:uncharacterized protein LOC129943941 [Eupeodes corollae]|uniref:uncharacterized protein LOC129943941 n=1 Tax=Eupeodes corollae TaxID=290404 RepID=UPI0024917C56|nr:uncharacterized protein LOC129943941 [Eupeodes corollae]
MLANIERMLQKLAEDMVEDFNIRFIGESTITQATKFSDGSVYNNSEAPPPPSLPSVNTEKPSSSRSTEVLTEDVTNTTSSAVKRKDPDPDPADTKASKKRATETINTILNEEGLEEIGKIIRNQPFSLIIDETTDVSTTKCLVLVVRYFDFVVCKVRDKFLSLISIENCDSLNIYKTIVTFFQNIQVPHKNIVGFASDNASVMMGKKSGVKTLLQKDQPHLYVMGCICHSLHLCSSAASKKLPSHLEALTRNIYSFFAHSPKRKLKLEEFQKYFSVEVHKILKMSSTRWLSLENVISRILEQWRSQK